MNVSSKVIIGLGVLAVGGTATYFIVKERKRRALLAPPNSTGTNTNIIQTAITSLVPGYVPEKFPLAKGMKGNTVRRVQSVLNTKFNAGLKEDGLFGAKTEAALYKAIGKKVLSPEDFAKYAKHE